MMQLLHIYLWTIVAGGVAAAALAIWGAQLAARDKSMQTLCIGQGAMLGVLVGIGVTGSPESQFLPFLLAVLVSLGVGQLGVWIDRRRLATPATWFSAVFAGLLALNYLVSALFPGLESHMAQVFFGDLATLSEFGAWLTMAAAFAMLLTQLTCWRTSSNQSFELMVFGGELRQSRSRWTVIVDVGSFVFVCFSIQFLGFLFTIALLFVPTIIVNLTGGVGLRQHLMYVAIVSVVCTVTGFLISLQFTRMPTVPTIVAMMLLPGSLLTVLVRGFGLTAWRRSVKRRVE